MLIAKVLSRVCQSNIFICAHAIVCSSDYVHSVSSIPSLQHLEQLDLGGNSLLLRIPSSLCDLVSLTNIGCEGCVSMSYPPYDICTQGVAAMRTYFTELENTHEISKEFVPVTGRMTDHSLNTVEQHQMGWCI